MTPLEAAYASAHGVLSAYVAAPPDQRPGLVAALRPRDPDYHHVFEPATAAAAAQHGYIKLWGNRPVWPVREPRLEIHCATTEALAEGKRDAQPFPGGYREIACYLRKGLIWVAWTIATDLYDGLVEVEPGRWAWFPRPWKVLPKPPTPTLWFVE